MKNCKLLLAALSGMALVGCSTSPNKPLSYEIQAMNATNAEIVVSDLVTILSNEYAPNATVFSLTNVDQGVFGEVLQRQLRDAGYGIVHTDNIESNHTIVYVVDDIGFNDLHRVSLRVTPKFQIDSLYKQSLDGAWFQAGGATVKNKVNDLSPKPLPPKPVIPAQAVRINPDNYKSQAISLDTVRYAPSRNNINGIWAIQVMAGHDYPDLAAHKAKLESKGYHAFIVETGTSGKLKALRHGYYQTFNSAKPDLYTLKRFYSDAYIVKKGE
ncbi:hypothetical protein JFQ72_004384 [Vibrio parahaemolyticus]|nr:hypothetical protein [Vibrio parahaemolyticus]